MTTAKLKLVVDKALPQPTAAALRRMFEASAKALLGNRPLRA